MNGPRIAELCAGYGGISLAVEAVLGGEVVLVADNDPGAAAILAHRYPDVPNIGDIAAAIWDGGDRGKLGVDILCAGFPCLARTCRRPGNGPGCGKAPALGCGAKSPAPSGNCARAWS